MDECVYYAIIIELCPVQQVFVAVATFYDNAWDDFVLTPTFIAWIQLIDAVVASPAQDCSRSRLAFVVRSWEVVDAHHPRCHKPKAPAAR